MYNADRSGGVDTVTHQQNMPRNKTDLRIHDEISYLSNKISEIEQQLREEKKVIHCHKMTHSGALILIFFLGSCEITASTRF